MSWQDILKETIAQNRVKEIEDIDMDNLKLFKAAMKELRKGNEKVAHEIAKAIKCNCKYENEIEKMRCKK